MVHADTLLMFYFICDGGLFTPFNMIEWKTHLSILQGLFLDFAYFFKILLTSFKGFSCFPFPETRLAKPSNVFLCKTRQQDWLFD